MLSTLIKLGEQLSDGRGEWDDIIDFPNITKEREKNINCFVV
jgi:CRISPR-associated protein Csh1